MSEEIAETVLQVRASAVFQVEDGGIWFSGMNARVSSLAGEVRRRLTEDGYSVGDVENDEAAVNSGLYLPVEEAEEVPEHVYAGAGP